MAARMIVDEEFRGILHELEKEVFNNKDNQPLVLAWNNLLYAIKRKLAECRKEDEEFCAEMDSFMKKHQITF